MVGSSSGSEGLDSSEESSDGSTSDEVSSSNKAAEEEDTGEEVLEDVGAVTTPEAMVVKEEPRLATSRPVLAVVPPSSSKGSTERDDSRMGFARARRSVLALLEYQQDVQDLIDWQRGSGVRASDWNLWVEEVVPNDDKNLLQPDL